MDTLDAHSLPGLPAPFWFVQFFKVLGFTLHQVPMHLWFAGILTAVGLYAFGGEQARRFTARLMRQMPLWIALGINFGIVPLLFLQAAYYKAFYPATILTAWSWLAVIVLLIPAYYGAYAYVFGLKGPRPLSPGRQAVGWTTAALFVVLSLLFVNALTLMTNSGDWKRLWLEHNVAGAATGTALNLADPTFWPRWLLTFGMALVTVAVWTLVDAAWLDDAGDRAYRAWARRLAGWLSLLGAAWATAAGLWYAAASRPRHEADPLVTTLLIAATAAPWLVRGALWVLRGPLGRAAAVGLAVLHLGVLAFYAVTRQIAQNVELAALFQGGVAAQPENVQWSPLAAFLLTFALGAAVLAWMAAQVVKAPAAVPESPA